MDALEVFLTRDSTSLRSEIDEPPKHVSDDALEIEGRELGIETEPIG